MIHHKIKIHPTHFIRVLAGTKTFEIRDNDRAYQRGDTVTLLEFDPTKNPDPPANQFTGREKTFTIGDVYPINEESVVFSLLEHVK